MHHEENWMGLNKIDIEVDSENNTSADESEQDKNKENHYQTDGSFHNKNFNNNIKTCEVNEYSECVSNSLDSLLNSSLLNPMVISNSVSEIEKKCIKNADNKKVDKKKKNRGKFVTPCKDFNLILQKPKKQKRGRKLIKNYKLLPAKKIKNEKKYVLNSSVVDSLVEVIISGYINVKLFQTFINNVNEMLKCLIHFFLCYSNM